MVQEQNHHHHHHQPKYVDGNGASTGVARASKKNKPKKVPQRGLGVAQLEKLRIEEQKKNEGGMSTSSPHSLHSGLGLLPPLHPPPPLPASTLPRHVADLSAQMRHSVPASPRSASVDCNAHGGFLPMLWNAMDPASHPFKRSQCSQPHAPVVSTGLSLTASSSHQTEPPSNQISSSGSWSSLVSSVEEERETVGAKTPWPFQFEGMPAAAFPSKAPWLPGAARTASEFVSCDVNPDMIRYEFRANPFSSSASAKYGDWRADVVHCKSSKENGSVSDAGFLTLSTQPVPLTKLPQVMPAAHIQEYNEFSFMPSQGSISRQPFYSFLPVGPVRCEKALNEWKTDVSDGVDLDLKLWKS